MALPTLYDPSPSSIEVIPQLAAAEANAIRELTAYLATQEGQAADESDLQLWVSERGWHPSKLRHWGERIAAELAVGDPHHTDPRLIIGRLSTRLDRLANQAESLHDFKDAIDATEASAKLHNLGGYAGAKAPPGQVNVQVNIGNAHTVSDADLERVIAASATAVAVDPCDVRTEDPLLA